MSRQKGSRLNGLLPNWPVKTSNRLFKRSLVLDPLDLHSHPGRDLRKRSHLDCFKIVLSRKADPPFPQ
jgi:hypothetical protein